MRTKVMILTRKSNRKDWNARATNNLIIFISTNQRVNDVFLAQSNCVRPVVSGVEVSAMPSSPTANSAEFIKDAE